MGYDEERGISMSRETEICFPVHSTFLAVIRLNALGKLPVLAYFESF